MIGLAERTEITTYTGEEWAPFRAEVQEDDSRHRSRFSGVGVIAAFLFFSAVTVAVARGQSGLAESFGISEESLHVAAWMVQGAAALFCFALAVRWLRSESH